MKKKGLLYKERICSCSSPYRVNHFSERDKIILTESSPLKCFQIPLNLSAEFISGVGWGGVGVGLTSLIWHSTDVRAE